VHRVFDDDLDNEAILLVLKAKRLLLCHSGNPSFAKAMDPRGD